jgi:hypothetical protein
MMDLDSLFSVRQREELMILLEISEMSVFKELQAFMEIKLSTRETELLRISKRAVTLFL